MSKNGSKTIKRKKYNTREKREPFDLEFQRKGDRENGGEDIIKDSFNRKNPQTWKDRTFQQRRIP